MFIENVPLELYISDPSQLEVGMRIWSVGQGGITTVEEPYDLGIITKVECSEKKEFFEHELPKRVLRNTRSYSDHHIISQTYNNWYICNDLDKANQLYEFLKNAWETDAMFEVERLRWINTNH